MSGGKPRRRQSGAAAAGRWLAGEGLGPFLVRSVAGSGAVRLAGMAASFAAGVLLARGLGVEGYGFYSLALAVITIAAIPGELGLPYLVTREVAAASATRDDGKLFGVLRWADRTTAWIAGGIALLIAAAGLALSGRIAPALAGALVLGAPVIPLIALAKTRGAALQGLNHVVRGQVPWSLLRPLLLALMVGALMLAGTPVTAPAAMALNSLVAAIVLAISFVWLRQRLPQSRPAILADGGRGWLASALPMGAMEGMRVLQAELAILLVGLIAAPGQVGLLRIAIVTAMMAAAATAIVGQATMPILARLHAQKDRERLQKTVTGAAQAQFVGVVVLSLPLLVFGEPLIALAFGQAYVPAADALRILAAAQIVNAAFGPNAWVLSMAHHEKRVARAMALALLVTALAVPLLTIEWGIEGAAVALFASTLCWNLIAWSDSRKFLGIETSILRWPWRGKPGAPRL